MSKIKYCIWDVGNVIYNYSLDPLHNYFASETSDQSSFNQKKGTFNYNEYMKGNVEWNDFCKGLCEFYSVPYSKNKNTSINKALHQGIGQYFPETRKTQEYLASKGIENCILSNALPILANSNNALDIIKKENVFCSFELGLLKPDPEIYKKVAKKLKCDLSEIIFIDDKPKNTKSAADLGIHAITFNSSTIENDVKRILNNQSINPKLLSKSKKEMLK